MADKTAGKNNLVDNIYLSLKQDILWLRLKPRTMLTEQSLAEIYSTSKTPIREALAKLICDGLIKVFPYKGYMVSDISYSDVKNLFEYRWVLENANLCLAIKSSTADQLQRLETLADKLESYTDEEPKFSPLIKSNNDFHLCLAEITGNPIMLEQLVCTIEKLQRVMWLSATEGSIDVSIREHFKFVEYIRNKDLAGAQLLMKKHIDDVLGIALSNMSKTLF
ncbi:MAG: GntR family transcriptional regulator [Synergistaceae bacterium]|nr:GntR family transcriptional regulator [Synergistaceae bacterium]